MERPAILGGTPVRDTFLVFGSPAIEESDIREVVACLRSGWLGTGPRVAQFERDFSRYKGATHAVAVSSCTAALHLSMVAVGLQPGDEVITTALTFCATCNAIAHAGATPVLVDVDPVTMNIDPVQIERSITSRTRAIVPVHFAGRACEMGLITELSSRHELRIIEDCAHAIETEHHGRKAGTFGDFGCFSFYVTKNVTAGEGGMVLTRSEEDAARLKVLALHGMSKDAWTRFGDEGYKHYRVVDGGFKYNMIDLVAAIGCEQLLRVEQNWLRREQIWQRYLEAFRDLPVVLPAAVEPGTRHAYHLFTILIDEARTGVSRDTFLEALAAENVGAGVHYPSLAEHPYYQDQYGWRPEDYREATQIGRQTVSLPLSVKLSDSDVDDVVCAVSRVLHGYE